MHGKANGGKPRSPIDAAATIELLVAQTLGFSAEQLGVIFDPDPSDRRGFWRYFAGNQQALAVVKRAIDKAQGGVFA